MPKKTLRKSAQRKPLTRNQKIALQRRAVKRELNEALDGITRQLTGDDPLGAMPANYRARTAKALNVLLHGGPVFVLACVKAYLSRTFPRPSNDEIWQFIDEQNAKFAGRCPPDMVERWNAPDYDELESGGR